MKSISTIRRLSVALFASALGVFALADQVGTPVTLGKGVRVTVAKLNALGAAKPKPTKQIAKRTEEEGPDRTNLYSANGAPEVSQWPPAPVNPLDLIKGDPAENDPGRSVLPFFTLTTSIGSIGSVESPGLIPPDTIGDVSPSSVVVVINGWIRATNKAGTTTTLNTDTDSFFNSVRGGVLAFDPRVVYDPISQRWFVSAINDPGTASNTIMLAVSDGENITASTVWTFYSFSQDLGSGFTGFADYVTLGVDANAVYMGTNTFDPGYVRSDLFVIRKSSVLSGGPMVVTALRNVGTTTGGMFTPWGCTNNDPAATEGVLVGVDSTAFSRINLARILNPGATPTLTSQVHVTVPTTNLPAPMPVNTGSGPGSLSAIDDRLFHARIFYDKISNTRTLWTAHNIRVNASGVASTAAGSRTGARWYEFQNVFSASPSLRQSGTVFDNAATTPRFFTIPTVAMNMQGHALVGGSWGNVANPAGVGTAHRFRTDALGSNTAVTLRHAGTGTYARFGGISNQRWGDYSSTVVDPEDGMSIWSFQEYISGVDQFAVRAVKLLAPAPTLTAISPSSANVGSTVTFTLTGTGLFDPGPGFMGRLAAAFGPGTTVNSVTFNSETQCTVNVTIQPSASTGSRNVVVTNPDGQNASIPITLNAPSKTITGTLTLSSYTGSSAALPLTIEVRDNVTNAVLQTQNLTGLAAGNTYSFPTTLANATYKLRIKFNNRFLGKVETFTLTNGVNTVNATLINGDVNGDNSVGTTDFNALRAALGSSSGGNADLNGDGSVGTIDFNILRASLGLTGQ